MDSKDLDEVERYLLKQAKERMAPLGPRGLMAWLTITFAELRAREEAKKQG